MTPAYRLYRLLRPLRLIELYLSLYICSGRWTWRLPRGRVLERPRTRDRIPCRTRQWRPLRGRKPWDGFKNVGNGLRKTRGSCRISDLPFKSRVTGRRARFRMIDSKIGDRVSEDIQLRNNSWHVSGSDGERVSCRTTDHHCCCGRQIVHACERTIQKGVQNPGYRRIRISYERTKKTKAKVAISVRRTRVVQSLAQQIERFTRRHNQIW